MVGAAEYLAAICLDPTPRGLKAPYMHLLGMRVGYSSLWDTDVSAHTTSTYPWGAPMLTLNEHTPVVGMGEILVDGAPEAVWDVLTGFEHWPTWNPQVKWVSVQGRLTVGTTFRWRTSFGTITSTLRRVEPPKLLAWTGTLFGTTASHLWRLTPYNGRTAVRTEESWEGAVVELFHGSFQVMLEKSLDASLRYLKAEVECAGGEGGDT
jgi:hypothetical protein